MDRFAYAFDLRLGQVGPADDLHQDPAGLPDRAVRQERRDRRLPRTHGAIIPVRFCRSRDYRPHLGQEFVHLVFRQAVAAKAGSQRKERIRSGRFKGGVTCAPSNLSNYTLVLSYRQLDPERRNMARRRRSFLALSGEQAQQALTVLIQEGKLAASEVRRALQRRDRLIRALRASLAALETGVGRVGRLLKDRSRALARKATTAERKLARRKAKRVSPNRRRAMQQQGQYLGAVRQLRPVDRAKVKKVRAEKGFATAIAEARRLRAG
jgi:hypothetical protein